jgi:rod shape-determining protein MreC
MIKLNRARIIVLSLVVSALILLVPAAVSRRVRLAAADLFEPITSTARGITGGIRARISEFNRGSELQQQLAEERRRRTEVETLLAEKIEEIARLRRARKEGTEVHEVIRQAKWRGVPLAANVIRRPGKWESNELVIDLGKRSGVGKGCPVLVGEAVLGVVVEAAEDTAHVLVLGHPEVAVPARIVQNRQQGLVESEGRRIKLNFVVRNRDRPVRKGYTVVTSGLGGLFPPGCLIGRVGPGVAPAEGKPFYDITLELPRAATNPEVVWVLVGPGRRRTGKPPAKKPERGRG